MSDLRKEIDILKRCDSPYVVRYYGSFQKDGDLWIVMELCAAGSLADLMAIADISLLEEEIAEAMAITLMGLAYLHSEKRIIHRDLKAGALVARFAPADSCGHSILARAWQTCWVFPHQ